MSTSWRQVKKKFSYLFPTYDRILNFHLKYLLLNLIDSILNNNGEVDFTI